MKICAIICEYNPLHNGHLYQLREAKRLSNADALLCLMSGNFVQRGENAILDKFTRAKHAVMAGADAVIELPTLFATSNAELFAKGAIHILSSIPEVTHLCFGCEDANKLAFLSAARYLNDEPQEVSNKIKDNVALGVSYAKARAEAWAGYIPMSLLCSPNNILGLEYTRAILEKNAQIEILPIERVGGGYKQTQLHESYSSASAIRCHIQDKELIKDTLPDFVFEELPNTTNERLQALEKYALLCKNKNEIAQVCDCSEGLENAFKKAAEKDCPLEESLTSARYTSSRIRRIALQNLLNITKSDILSALSSPLYLRILAIRKENNEILTALSKSNFPLLVRAHDENALLNDAKKSFEIDKFADKVYALLNSQTPPKNIFY